MAALHFDWRELEMDIYQVDFLKHRRFYMLMLPVFQGLRLDLWDALNFASGCGGEGPLVQFQVNFSYHQNFLTLMQLLNRRLYGRLLELQQLTMERGSHQ